MGRWALVVESRQLRTRRAEQAPPLRAIRRGLRLAVKMVMGSNGRMGLAVLFCAVFSVGTAARAGLQSPNSTPAASRGAARVVVDETGRRVTLPAEVRRIVSLAPNVTETIYAIGAGARLAGDTDFCDVPEEANAKPHVGAPINPSLEAIVALKPDVVLASASINWPATADSLLKIGVPVYTTDAHSVEGMLAGIEKIGGVIGAEAGANALVSGLRGQLEALRAKLAGRAARRVLFVVWDEPLISIGKHTFVADALRLSGGASVIDVDAELAAHQRGRNCAAAARVSGFCARPWRRQRIEA